MPPVPQRSSEQLVDNRPQHFQLRVPNAIQSQRPTMQQRPVIQMPHRFEQPVPRFGPQYQNQANMAPLRGMPQQQPQFMQQQPAQQQQQYQQQQQQFGQHLQYPQQQQQFQQQQFPQVLRQPQQLYSSEQQQPSSLQKSWPPQLAQTNVMQAPPINIPQQPTYAESRSLPMYQDSQQPHLPEGMYPAFDYAYQQPEKYYPGPPQHRTTAAMDRQQPQWVADQQQRQSQLYNQSQHYSLPNSMESSSSSFSSNQYAGSAGSGMFDVQQHQLPQFGYHLPPQPPQMGSATPAVVTGHHLLPQPPLQHPMQQQQPVNVQQQPTTDIYATSLPSWPSHVPPPPPASTVVQTTNVTGNLDASVQMTGFFIYLQIT
jgi:hypothetical protein